MIIAKWLCIKEFIDGTAKSANNKPLLSAVSKPASSPADSVPHTRCHSIPPPGTPLASALSCDVVADLSMPSPSTLLSPSPWPPRRARLTHQLALSPGAAATTTAFLSKSRFFARRQQTFSHLLHSWLKALFALW